MSPLGLREIDGIEVDARRLIHWVEQFFIVVLTLPGMWLITSVGPEARWGYVMLLAAQPFWLLSNWRSRQMGMFAIAIVFAALWLRGIFNHFPF